MIAPTTLAVAAIFSAVKMYGSADGTRSFQRIVHPRAAYECMSSSAQGSADWSPRRVLTVTGKNVRYAAITETRTQSGGGPPPIETLPSPRTTIGASARMGIVCEATTYGMTPRRSTSKCARTTPSTNPTTAPNRNPTAAARAVKSAACRR